MRIPEASRSDNKLLDVVAVVMGEIHIVRRYDTVRHVEIMPWIEIRISFRREGREVSESACKSIFAEYPPSLCFFFYNIAAFSQQEKDITCDT